MAEKNLFTEIYDIDVTDRMYDKNGNTYLPWASAFSEIAKKHPDVTYEFNLGASKEIKRVIEFGATKAILKSKSPSCGVNIIYDGTFSGNTISGDGVFTKELKKLGIEIFTELDF